jgi:hypothetical protein
MRLKWKALHPENDVRELTATAGISHKSKGVWQAARSERRQPATMIKRTG